MYALDDQKVLDRFWSKVDIRGASECWLWTAHVTPYGYGDFTFNRRTYQASRFAMMLTLVRYLESTECVLHDCPGGDNPLCVNPNHLWIGSHADNSSDMVNKGRAYSRGNTPTKKLSDSEVQSLRLLHLLHDWTLAELAEKFGISVCYAGALVRANYRKG